MCEVFCMIDGVLLVLKMGLRSFCVSDYDGENKKGCITGK
jgi:hypothetical protein